jgi:hypothetical protein
MDRKPARRGAGDNSGKESYAAALKLVRRRWRLQRWTATQFSAFQWTQTTRRSATHTDTARCYHPDVGTGSSLEQFRRATTTYETLIDPARRQAHDLVTRWTNQPSRVDSTVPVLYQ